MKLKVTGDTKQKKVLVNWVFQLLGWCVGTPKELGFVLVDKDGQVHGTAEDFWLAAGTRWMPVSQDIGNVGIERMQYFREFVRIEMLQAIAKLTTILLLVASLVVVAVKPEKEAEGNQQTQASAEPEPERAEATADPKQLSKSGSDEDELECQNMMGSILMSMSYDRSRFAEICKTPN